jgi:hypothetical protein
MKKGIAMRNVQRWQSALVALMFGAMIAPAGSAVADCPVEPWAEELLVAQNDTQNDGNADGIGGSGILPGGGDDEDGIGGSGIYGTVTGFGSICLNGRRLIYDEDVVLTTDEASSVIEELAVGHVVLVDFEDDADGLRARSIQIQHALVGPVTAYRDDVLEVMGERVFIEALANEELGWVEVGIRVAVSGLRGPEDRLIVSRVDLATESSTDLVRGELIVDQEGHRQIGTIRLETSDTGADRGDESRPAPILVLAESGSRQRMQGRWNDMRSLFEVADAAASPVTLKMSRRVDVEGYVTRVSGGDIQIGEVRLRIEGHSSGQIVEVGDRVRVRGRLDRDRKSFRATSMVRLPRSRFLRSLDRAWHAPQSARERIDDSKRPQLRDDEPHMRPRHRLRRHHIDRIRPDQPQRPRPRRDVIDRRGTS